MDLFPPTKQRPALLPFLAAIGARDNTLRRDECSDWRIKGERGWIYAGPEGYQLCFFARNGVTEFDGAGPHIEDYVRAKRALAFCRLIQDGTGEGIFLLDRLPTRDEGETIREIFAIAKKREMGEPSEAQRAALANFLARAAEQRTQKPRIKTPPTAETDPPAPLPPDQP